MSLSRLQEIEDRIFTLESRYNSGRELTTKEKSEISREIKTLNKQKKKEEGRLVKRYEHLNLPEEGENG